jgi:transposase
MTNYIGIDIGKEKINYAFAPGHSLGTGVITNTTGGIADFLSRLPQDSHCVMEATGMYHFPLAYALQDKGFALTIVNPIVSKSYAQSLGSISKTDNRDAVMLQQLGTERQLVGMQLPDGEWQAFRHRIKHWQNLQHDIQVLKNRLGALAFHPSPDALSLEMMQEQLELLQKQLKKWKNICKRICPSNIQNNWKKVVV